MAYMILCRDMYWDSDHDLSRGWVSADINGEEWEAFRTTDGSRFRLINSVRWSHLIYRDTIMHILRTARMIR